jgi:acetyl esterase
MAIPLRMQLLWKVLSGFGAGSADDVPAAEVPAARERRRRLLAMPGSSTIVGKAHPDVLASTKSVDGAGGSTISARIYRPAGAGDELLPAVVHLHGGGYVLGDPQQSEWWCSSVAHDANVVVVSVDYRQAPEHPYPTSVEDAYAAVRWVVLRAADIGAQGEHLAVMGDSLGGGLAAAVCLMARDRGGPTIMFQLLLYPAVDMVNHYPSEDENEFAPILGKADLAADAVSSPGAQHEPYASPLLGDHHGLPSAMIMTAQHDPLRDQGAAYAEALRAAAVEVRLTNYVDAVHGFVNVPGAVPASRQALADAAAALRTALHA